MKSAITYPQFIGVPLHVLYSIELMNTDQMSLLNIYISELCWLGCHLGSSVGNVLVNNFCGRV